MAFRPPIDALVPASDTTALNATTNAHGLLPKLSGVSTEYLSGTGVFSTPAGGEGGGDPSDTVAAETSFGMASAAGAAAEYSRGDHTHGTPTDPVIAHVAASDPHVQYQRESEKGAALGYPDLDSGTKVPVAQLPAVTALAGFPGGTATFLRADQTFAAPAGGGSFSATQVTVNLPYPASRRRGVVVADAAMTPTDKILLSVAGVPETQANASDALDLLSLVAVPGSGNLTIQLASLTPMAGPIVVNYARSS